MKVLKISFVSLLVLFLFFNGVVQARTVGSNKASSRQLKTFFPASQTDNKMVGFAVFEKGLSLENSETSCLYDAFFPISGDIVLNGGELTLMRDVEIKSPFSLGAGTIDGANSFALEFPGNVSGIDIPSFKHTKLLDLFYSDDLDVDVYSVDWSFDDNYLAVACRAGSGKYEMQIYYFEDLNLTLTATKDLGSSDSALSLRWHPSDYYLAVGESSGDELEIYYLDVAAGLFEKKDGVSTSDVTAVAWSPDGSYLAVGRAWNYKIIIYDIDEGTLGDSYSVDYSSPAASKYVQKNALDWDSTSSYIAVGLSSVKDGAELKVFYFDGATVIQNAEAEMKSTVYAVGWHPSLPYLAVGKSSGSERLVLFEHDSNAETLTEASLSCAGATRTVYGLRWSEDGNFVGAVIDASSTSFDLGVFSFDSLNLTLNLVSGYRSGHDLAAIAYSHDGNYIATGDRYDYFKVFQLVQRPLIFKDVNLFFKSDVTFRGPVIFEGNCLINGGGNIFDFDESGAIVVAAGSNLFLEDASIRSISSDNIACLDNDSVLTLRDIVWQQDSLYTFSVGALKLKNNILMSGDATFVYASAKTSTLLSKSELELDIGFTFSYDPGLESKVLFEFEDETSKLTLNGATLHSTVTGMQLTKGSLRVMRDSFLSSELQEVEDELGNITTIDEGITFGDATSGQDFQCNIFSGVTFWVTAGSLNYKNVNSSSWQMHNVSSELRIGSGVALNIYESMDLGSGVLVFENRAILAKASGKNIVGSISPLGTLFKASV